MRRFTAARFFALGTLCSELAQAASQYRQWNVRGAAKLYDMTWAKDPMSAYLDDLKATGVKVRSVEDMFDDAVDTHAVESLGKDALLGKDNANATAATAAKLALPKRQVVIARYDEDVNWLKKLPENFDISVYQSKDPSVPHFVENVGNEASKYLSYIVDNYDSLPDTVAFMQAGRMDWHDPVPKDVTMRGWDWDAARARGGIAFLPTAAPCLIEDSDPAPVTESLPDVGRSSEREQRRKSVPTQEKCVDVVEHTPPQMATVRSVWGEIFESELGPLPKHWLTHCCAQFHVTREAIRQHPREFYERLLKWAMDHDRSLLQSDYGEEMKRNHDEARRDAGHVFEVLWVLIFSDPMTHALLA
mmetsp:Transcript_114372/g.180032  ORF Transcript_114372/g.180032 Transcript_114372/m.180032 type:complete len:360 (+) Transcript_114372:73-1152(+)